MSATILERVMQKYDCTTIEELKNKHQEFDQAANSMAQMFSSAAEKNDYRHASELLTLMTDNSIKLSEIEKAVRDL
jgi:hypothetical protein